MTRIVECHEIGDKKFRTPFRLLVGGSSGCGKSTFIKKIVDKNFFDARFSKIIYIYPTYLNDPYIEFTVPVEYRPGLDDLSYYSTLPRKTLIIIDDSMDEVAQSSSISKLFSVIARKKEISIILISQNIYHHGKYFRNIRINATGFVLFKFSAAFDINSRLTRDLGLSNILPKTLLDRVYSDAFAYIVYDLHPMNHSQFCRIRTNIFNDNFLVLNKMEYVAIPKSDFLKYFKVLESKKGTIRAVRNAVALRSGPRKQGKRRIEQTTSSDNEEDEESNIDSTEGFSTD
jgi:hypothetical protein